MSRTMVLLLGVFVIHCGPHTATSDGGPDATIDTTPPDVAADADTGIDIQSSCAADFPCFGRRWACRDTTTYTALIDHDCHYSCGPGSCTGGTCDPSDSLMTCPAGTMCVASPYAPGGTPDPRSTPCELPDSGSVGDAGDS